MERNGATSRVAVVTGASMGIGRAIATTWRLLVGR